MPTIAQGSDEMESKIDWSKAPEDADKYNTHNSMFYKGERPYFQVFARGQWMQSALMKSNEVFVYRPTTPSWSGEGLPPVGVVCEMHYCGEWEKTEILCIGVKHVFIRQIAVTGEAFECSLNLSACQFRPIRTPEQIESDARIKAAQEWLKSIELEYGEDVADQCENILMAAEEKRMDKL